MDRTPASGAGPPCPGPFLRRLPTAGETGQGQRAPASTSLGTPVLLTTHPIPPPPSARLILTTTIRPSRLSSHPPTTVTTVPPTAQPLVAWLPAPRPQGHIYTNTEGTRSRREYVCFKISVFWPHSHWPKKHQGGGAGVLQVTWWLQTARPGRWVLAAGLA